MLRYYSYYSIGGYKDLYLGSSEDKAESTYYLPLLPVLEESAKTDADAKKQFEELKDLPQIYQLSDKQNYGLPSAAAPLFSHAGYKLIYKHVEGNTHAVALRDITCGAKDEMGRNIPFLMVITCDTADDVKKLDRITTYMASYLKEAEAALASFIGYDKDKNGLRFKLAEFNAWIDKVLSENDSCKVATNDGVIRVKGTTGKVALLTLPSGISTACAITEQNIQSNEINSVDMANVISKVETEKLVSQLEKTSEELKQANATNAAYKKIMIAAGVGGAVLGLLLGSCLGK